MRGQDYQASLSQRDTSDPPRPASPASKKRKVSLEPADDGMYKRSRPSYAGTIRTLIAGSGDNYETYYVHEPLLTAASRYLSRKLATNSPGNRKPLLLAEFDPEYVENFIDYLYTGTFSVIHEPSLPDADEPTSVFVHLLEQYRLAAYLEAPQFQSTICRCLVNNMRLCTAGVGKLELPPNDVAMLKLRRRLGKLLEIHRKLSLRDVLYEILMKHVTDCWAAYKYCFDEDGLEFKSLRDAMIENPDLWAGVLMN